MKRIFACLFVIAVLPLVTSPTQNSSTQFPPFAAVAFAGHAIGGSWCGDCGVPGCLCDPGEVPGGNRATPVSDSKPSDQGLSPLRARSHSGFDFGTGALLLALALFLWARLRA